MNRQLEIRATVRRRSARPLGDMSAARSAAVSARPHRGRSAWPHRGRSAWPLDVMTRVTAREWIKRVVVEVA